MKLLTSIILASRSEARYRLLSQLGLRVKILSSIIDAKEDLGIKKINSIDELIESTKNSAKRKVEAVKLKLKSKKNLLVLGADTVVYSDNFLLGKPKDEIEAEFMLNLLSGKLQYIITGIALHDGTQENIDVEVSKVKLKRLKEDEIKGYIKSKEYIGKSGGICIQGKGALFVEYIEGCYYNIVGLPIFRFYSLLDKLGYSLF